MKIITRTMRVRLERYYSYSSTLLRTLGFSRDRRLVPGGLAQKMILIVLAGATVETNSHPAGSSPEPVVPR